MDITRVARRPASPSRSIDGFSIPGAEKQTAKQKRVGRVELDSLLPAELPTEVVAVSPDELAPPRPRQKKQFVESKPAADSPVVAVSGRLSPFDLASIEEIEKPKNRLTPGRAFRKWFLRGGLAVLVLCMTSGGVLFAQGYGKVHKVFQGNAGHAAALQANVAPALLKGEGAGRINVLLLGNGGTGHDGADLTDTMMVASIDPVNGTATLLSVPRDLWVKMPINYFGANQKINAAYESGKYKTIGKVDSSNANTQAVQAGFKAADQVISEVLGVTIHYNVVVNFTAFRQAVDTVGGVTVNVPQQLYDPTMAWENHNSPILAAAGVQQMDGVHALLYARSRETSSDFARGERQRAIILALKEKILTAGTLSNPLKISQLMGNFGDNMVTDISLSDAARMYDLTKGIGSSNITSLDLVTAPHNLVTTGNNNGISIDQPRAGLFNYADIQTFVRTSLRDGYLAKENAKVTVLNGTAKEGLATTKANELQSYGYNVTQTGNAPTRAYAKTVVVDFTKGADKYTLNYLQKRYGVQAVKAVPDPTLQRGNADFMIILGNDQQ